MVAHTPVLLDEVLAGPLARSAFDLTLAMDVLTSPLKAFGALGWVPLSWRDAGVPASRMRVAIVADDACAECDANVRDGLRSLAVFLRSQGLQVG